MMDRVRLAEWERLLIPIPDERHPVALLGDAVLMHHGFHELLADLRDMPAYADTVSPPLLEKIPKWEAMADPIPDDGTALVRYVMTIHEAVGTLIQVLRSWPPLASPSS